MAKIFCGLCLIDLRFSIVNVHWEHLWSYSFKMGWKIWELSLLFHGLRKMTWVKLDGLSRITLPATGTMENGSFIFCSTLNVVLWWQAIGFQIFIVVSEMPSFCLSWECVFQICQKNLDIVNCKTMSWVRKMGEEDPRASQETSSKATNIHANTWFFW